MSDYWEILEEIPEGLRGPLGKLIERLEDRLTARLAVKREDFIALRHVVEELAEAQAKTEKRIGRVEEGLDKVEDALARLAEAQARTEKRVEELAEAQAKTEKTLREFTAKMGAVGARWGLGSESAFREAMRGILKDVGFEARRYLAYDDKGLVFGRPDQVEIDVVVKDGDVYLVEIKSSTSRGDVATFARKVKFYEDREKVAVRRKILVTPFLEPKARDMAEEFGIEVYTEVEDLAERGG